MGWILRTSSTKGSCAAEAGTVGAAEAAGEEDEAACDEDGDGVGDDDEEDKEDDDEDEEEEEEEEEAEEGDEPLAGSRGIGSTRAKAVAFASMWSKCTWNEYKSCQKKKNAIII
jgi:hypothetical protein